MKIKNTIIFLLIISVLPLICAGNYGDGSYGTGVYSAGEVAVVTPPSESKTHGGSSSTIKQVYECVNDSGCKANQYCFNYTCYNAGCFNDSVCNTKAGETCWNHRCVKLFDMEILDFESSVKVGEFFDFTYFLKAVAEINGDVEVKFWIEQNGTIVTSGQDTIYFKSFEEKTKVKKLFLPSDTKSSTYTFYIQVTYGTYIASAHRTIEIGVRGGMATISIISDFTPYITYGLIGLGIFILFLIFYLERKKIKEGLISEGRWIKKHKVSILLLIFMIILGFLIYYFNWYGPIASWIQQAFLWCKVIYLTYFDPYGYYVLGVIGGILFIIGMIMLIKRKYAERKIVKKRKNKRKI